MSLDSRGVAVKAGPGVLRLMGRHASTLALIALLAAGGAVCLVFPCRVYECDAVIYATRAIHGDAAQSLEAAHLGFDFLEYSVAGLGQRFSPPASPVCILAYVSVAAGLTGVLFFWLLLRRLGASTGANLLLSGCLLFSYTYWHYSLQAESHIIAGLLLILLALQVHRMFGRPTVGNTLGTALILALAALIHQTSVLALPAIILGVMMLRVTGKRKRNLVLMLLLSSAVLFGVPTLYGGVCVTGGSTARDLWPWLISSHLQTWGQWRSTSLPAAAVGLVRSITGSHYVLGFEPVKRLALRLFPFASLQDEVRVAGLVPAHVRFALITVQAVLLTFFGMVVLGALKNLRSAKVTRDPYAGFLIVWMLTLTVFVIWWAPERCEFWIGILIPGLILLGLPGLSRVVSGMSLWAAAAVVAALFTLNCLGSIGPQAARVAEPETCVAVAIDAVVNSGDVVLSDCSFCGRASKYVRSFEKVNLLFPSVSAGESDTRSIDEVKAGSLEEMGSAVAVAPERLIAHAVCTVDSVLVAAEYGERSVYIIMNPLSEDAHHKRLYAEVLDAVQEEFQISEIVRLRAAVELRRIESRKL